MRLFEWADHQGHLVHVQEDNLRRPPRRTLYPFINTFSAGVAPTKGYTTEEVSLAYPEFANGKFLGRPLDSPRR